MKLCMVICMLMVKACFAQEWQAEIMGGVSGYSGDLTQSFFSYKTLGPSVNVNMKYQLPNKIFVLRAGISYGHISADDKNNKERSLIARNLNFKSNIIEGSLCVEVNLFDPDKFEGIPYLFGGVGVFYLNPYTFDKNNNKTFLRPLGTEGQGLEEYPDRRMISMPQLCIPFGGGWKLRLNEKYDVIYEVGIRYLFTDYLDDVSTNYVDPQTLLQERGQKAAELAYRQATMLPSIKGVKRGNPESKDWYYMTGIKLVMKLGKQ